MAVSNKARASFAKRITAWHRSNGRAFPWRGNPDPYAVLVAEILLQHTDAAKVSAVFANFLRAFPTPQRLAKASPIDVGTLIWGLGKHHRATDLPRLASRLVREYNGQV